MDTMNPGDSQPAKRTRAGVRRPVKQQLRIDMTPMVDLGFLLISFFVITAELSKPTAMNLIMPKEGPPIELGDSDALTVLIDGNNQAWYYEGDWAKAKEENRVTALKGKTAIRKIIMQKQQWLDTHNKIEGRKGLMLLFKPGKNTSYKELVDMLDEVAINDVKKYAVLKQTEAEKQWITESGEN